MADSNKTNVLPVKHTTYVLQRLDEQRHKGLFCDATLIVEGEKFQVHRSFLAANSNYFMSLFTSAKEQNTFVLAGVPLTGFRVLLDFVYTATFVLNISTVHDVYKASSALDFQHVQTACEKVYKKIKQMERSTHTNSNPSLHIKKSPSNTEELNNVMKSKTKGATVPCRVHRDTNSDAANIETTFTTDRISSDDSMSPIGAKSKEKVSKKTDFPENLVLRKNQEIYLKRKIKLESNVGDFIAVNNSPKRGKVAFDNSHNFQPSVERSSTKDHLTSSIGIDYSRLSPFMISNITSEAPVNISKSEDPNTRLISQTVHNSNENISPIHRQHSSEECNYSTEKQFKCSFKATLAEGTVQHKTENVSPNSNYNDDISTEKLKGQRNRRKLLKTTRITNTNNDCE